MGCIVFYDCRNGDLYDECVEFTDRMVLSTNIHRDSILSSLFPLEVFKVKIIDWRQNLDLNIIMKSCSKVYEFEIVYVGDFDSIAKSSELGEIYLPKEKYLQYEVGKKLQIQFLETKNYQDTSLSFYKPHIVC